MFAFFHFVRVRSTLRCGQGAHRGAAGVGRHETPQQEGGGTRQRKRQCGGGGGGGGVGDSDHHRPRGMRRNGMGHFGRVGLIASGGCCQDTRGVFRCRIPCILYFFFFFFFFFCFPSRHQLFVPILPSKPWPFPSTASTTTTTFLLIYYYCTFNHPSPALQAQNHTIVQTATRGHLSPVFCVQ